MTPIAKGADLEKNIGGQRLGFSRLITLGRDSDSLWKIKNFHNSLAMIDFSSNLK